MSRADGVLAGSPEQSPRFLRCCWISSCTVTQDLPCEDFELRERREKTAQDRRETEEENP